MYLAVHSHLDCIFVPPGLAGEDYDNQAALYDLAILTSKFIKENSILVSDDVVQSMNDWNTELADYCACADEVADDDCPCGIHDSPGELPIKMKTYACDYETLSEATGGADDWALLKGAKYAYTSELPPGGGLKTSAMTAYSGCLYDSCDEFQVNHL